MADRTVKPTAVLDSGWGLRAAGTAPLGAGHINDTLLVTTTDGHRLVLQRINETGVRGSGPGDG